MTDSEIISIFTAHPAPTSNGYAFEWFKDISALLGIPTSARAPEEPEEWDNVGALVDWKDRHTKQKQSYLNVCVLQFYTLYHHAMMAMPDDFEYVPFKALFKQLRDLELQLPCGSDVWCSIKFYMNLVYGQLDHGPVRYKYASRDDITRLARKQMESVYGHPSAIYADTDLVVIQSDLADVDSWVSSRVDCKRFPYIVEKYGTFEIKRIKQCVSFHDKQTETRYGY